MKKLLSLIISATLSLTPLTAVNTYAEGGKVENMVIFGDSIAEGFGLDPETEYTYGDICSDYLGCNVENYAVSGLDSDELCVQLENLDDTKRQAVENADVVVISIGGNNIIHYTSDQILAFAGKHNLLNPPYTQADIPEEPNIQHLLDMVKFRGENSLEEYASDDTNKITLASMLMNLSRNLRLPTKEGIIPNQVMPDIQTAVNDIKAINPDTRIIVQTVYQPLQFSQEFIASEYGLNSGYASMLSILRSEYNDVMNTFRTELQKIDGIEIADVLDTFTSLSSISDSLDSTPGYAYYFTNMQCPFEAEAEGGKTKDFHPNQSGHLAIASVILDVIGEKNTSLNNLYMNVFRSLDDSQNYPAIAYKNFLKNLDIVPGDTNNDGFVDSIDSSEVMIEYALTSTGGRTFNDEEWVVADMNHDGWVDSIDASAMLVYYAWLSTGEKGNIFEYMYNSETGLTASLPIE